MKKLNLNEKKVIGIYENNISGTKIAKYFKCHFSVIYDILNKNNIDIKGAKFFNKGIISTKKNNNFEEFYGIERAKKIKEKLSKSIKNLWKNEEYSNKLKTIHKQNKNVNCFKPREKHPAWLGGKSFEPYTPEFNNKFRRTIRERDNYICIKCNIHQEKLSRTLSIHHINYDKQLSIPENCCALCIRCNVEVNSNRQHWTKFFQSLLSERYDYQYSENGEIILNLNKIMEVKNG